MKTYLARTFGSFRVGIALLGLLLLSRVADIATTYRFLSRSDWDYSREGNTIQRTIMQTIGFFPAMTLNIALAFTWTLLVIFIVQTLSRRAGFSERYVSKIGQWILGARACRSFINALHNLALLPFLSRVEWRALIYSSIALYLIANGILELKAQRKKTLPPD